MYYFGRLIYTIWVFSLRLVSILVLIYLNDHISLLVLLRLYILRGSIVGFNDVYINKVKSKCVSILFYGVDVLCLHGHELAKMSVVWNTGFRWVLGVRRNDRMKNHLKNCGIMSFVYLLELRFLLFLFNLKCESTQLLSRQSSVFFNSDIFKSLLSK